MKRRHDMPFGAECREDGSICFRLWAPAAQRVSLSLQNANNADQIPLERGDHGWFELTTNQAKAGSQYFFRIDDGTYVPDPASRFQPRDVHGPSEVIDPAAFNWQDGDWNGRPWDEAVIYELHVGAFTTTGTFSSVGERLDYLADIGVTAIELMPVADFPGRRNWGYDGVYPFAPDSIYGRPEHLKELVQCAHARGMMVLLDVVYNHFGPEGNYLNSYAPQFFTIRHHTPWGAAINFDGADSRTVRAFFIHNALYWLTEYHLDGLRLDAVHEIIDDSTPHILSELAATVRARFGSDRHIHLILENDRNESSYLARQGCRATAFNAQWNDDFHHALHTLVTGERDGYYSDFADRPLNLLGRSLSSGFAFQGEVSLFRNGKRRGESTTGLPPGAFVSFLQNHDQSGNRAFGERITMLADPQALRAATAILLLAPAPPLLFMGEEFGTKSPFLFFCDFEKGLAAAVTAGRRNEFARFLQFSDPVARQGIPDPSAERTFNNSQLDWDAINQPQHQEWLNFYRHLLQLRRQNILPLLPKACNMQAEYQVLADTGLSVRWSCADGSKLTLLANLGTKPVSNLPVPEAQPFYTTEEVNRDNLRQQTLPPWSVAWFSQP
jgi:malto-oligosyltrehalose trehalohydrolase